MEVSKKVGGITVSLLIKPGIERISVGRPINVAVDILNEQDMDISGTYALSDTPGDAFGGISGQIKGSFNARVGDDRDTLKDSVSFSYNGNLKQTQFLLDLEWEDNSLFEVDGICLKRNVNEDITGIECNAESVEKGKSSNSPIKITRAEKHLLDDNFDEIADSLEFVFDLSIDSDCKLGEDLFEINRMSAADVTGFDCNYDDARKELRCIAPVSISTDFYTGPLVVDLGYSCSTRLATNLINLKSEV